MPASNATEINQQASNTLRRHDWPGDIRVSASRSQAIEQEDDSFLTDTEMRERDKANILNVLRVTNWRVSRDGGAAELLGLKPSTLAYRMTTFGIEKTR